MKKNIIIFDNKTFPKGFVSKLRSNFKLFNFLIIKNYEIKKLNKIITNANALINCPRKHFNEDLLKKSNKLDWVHNGGAGVEAFINPFFSNSNIIFTNGKIIQGPEVADHAVGLLLSITRNIHYHYSNFNLQKLKRPIELYNKKALIVGFGGIGKCISERLSGFGMIIDVASEELPPITSEINIFHSPNSLYKIASKFDVVISAAPLTIKTKKFFNYNFFKNMKKESVFINVSRGGLVDTKALLKKNIYKKLLGVGLDVTEPEPLPANHRLRKIPNIIITNHTAGLSDHNRARSYKIVYENIYRYSKNMLLLNQVNKKEGY